MLKAAQGDDDETVGYNDTRYPNQIMMNLHHGSTCIDSPDGVVAVVRG